MKQYIHNTFPVCLRFLCATMLVALSVTSCQKEDETVTLDAVIADQPNRSAKVYVNSFYSYWHNGDKVYINGNTSDDKYTLSVTKASPVIAKIEDVETSTKYTAGYPAEYTEITGNGSLNITLPETQTYELGQIYSNDAADKAQSIVTPMAAYTEGTTLRFHNVGALIKVEIENKINQTMTLYAVEVESDKAPLSGTLAVTATEGGVSIGTTTDGKKRVSMRFSGSDNVVLDASSGDGVKTATIYIPILSIAESQKSNLTVHVLATGGDSKKYTFHGESASEQGVWIACNAMGSISCELNTTTCSGENAYFWGKGTPECPYLIENEADLIRLRDLVNSGTSSYNTSSVYFKQTQNITLNETKWGTPANLAIGRNYNTTTYFNAKYDGDNHWVELKITGIESSDITATSYIGLFGTVGGGGMIENLTMKGKIDAVEDAIAGLSIYLGSLVAYVNGNFTIKKCRNEINLTSFSVSGKDSYFHSCGGVCGYVNTGTVKFDYDTNKAIITGTGYNKYYIGGICGGSNNSGPSIEMDTCCNNGQVIANQPQSSAVYTGGIMGYVGAAATFNYCSNKEYKEGNEIVNTVSSNKQGCGGIAGYSYTTGSQFISCTNEGKIMGSSASVGGIIGGAANAITIRDCKNSGAVESISWGVGGMAGSGNSATITGCDNMTSGSIIGSERVGGIVGAFNKLYITNCRNYAIIGSADKTSTLLGGIVGQINNAFNGSYLDHCFNYGTIYSSKSNSYEAQLGGLIGKILPDPSDQEITIKNCGNMGSVLAVKNGKNVGGLIGLIFNSSKKSKVNIYNCYVGSDCSIRGGTYTGGLIGKEAVSTDVIKIENCYFNGSIRDSSNNSNRSYIGNFTTSSLTIRYCYAKSGGNQNFYNSVSTLPTNCAYFNSDGDLFENKTATSGTTISITDAESTVHTLSNLGNALRKWQEVNSDYTEWNTGNVPTLK